MKTHLPPGMLTSCMEFFLKDGTLMCISAGKLFPFREAPVSILQKIEDIILDHPEALIALDEMGIQDQHERLEQFCKCWFGDYDLKADVCLDGVISSEYYDCGARGSCPFEGRLCPGVKVNGVYISPRELQVVQLISQDLSDKLIGDRLDISPNTVKVHIAHLLAKIQCYTRVGIAMFAKERGIA